MVPAHTGPASVEVKPAFRSFQRVVPLLIIAALGTGVHQATIWLGTDLSTYLTTTVGRLVTLKLVAVLLLATVVARSLKRRRTTSRSPPGNTP